MYQKVFKRPIDIVISGSLILFLTPLFILIACLVFVDLGKPIFFRQARIGRNGERFTLTKFRTMAHRDHTDDDNEPNCDYLRITRLGSFLRAHSLDELPELWHVFTGKMSLIGPRPLPEEYRYRYSQFQFRRHEVRPGISGLAQVCGRNKLTWVEKFKLDVKYIDNLTLELDVWILFRTLIQVFVPQGINSTIDRTMEPFDGDGQA